MKTKNLMTMLMSACVLATTALATSVPAKPIRPIVDIQSGYLLGGSQGTKWVSAKQTAAQLKGRETYRLLGQKSQASREFGSKPHTNEAPCPNTFFVDIKPKQGAIAVSGNWNATPRTPQALSNNSAVYRNIVADILKQHNIKPNVKITQVARVDLEGDGTQEVLISATNHQGYDGQLGSISSRSLKNEYSMLFLRKVVGGKVVTQMLSEEYFVKDIDFNAPDIFTIAGVWDLNGDGKLEIVTLGRYYEGNWTTIYEMRAGKATKVLEAGCGA